MEEETLERGRGQKKSSHLGRGILIGIAGTLLVCMGLAFGLITFLGGKDVRVAVYRGGASSGETLDQGAVDSKLNMLNEIISSNFLFEYDASDLEDGIYKGYISGLGDVYTTYYTEEEYKELQQTTSGTYYGIGVQVTQDPESGYVKVTRVFKGSPAQEAGMRSGDIVTKVEDLDTSGTDLNVVVARIKGEEGDTVTLEIAREGESEPLVLEVERREVDMDTVEYRMLDDGVGYIELTEFDEVSYEQFMDAVDDLKGKGMTSLIVDIRDNPGGLLTTVVDLLDEFLPEGNIISIEYKDGRKETYDSDKDRSIDLPLAVLVNENSASASEIFAGALKDYGAGKIIGTQTFGKGIVQNIIPLSDGTAVKVTVARYYTPSGICIHGEGIAPDLKVEAAEDGKTDPQLDAAIDYLEGEND